MKTTKTILLPRLGRIMEELGENIKLSRLRRKFTSEQVAERAGIARSTLWQIEKGTPSVSIGTYLQVLFVLEQRPERRLQESDFLLGVYDEYRMVALRFKEDASGKFLNDNKLLATHPWTSLPELEQKL